MPSRRICNPPVTEFMRRMGDDRSWASQRRAYAEVYGDTVSARGMGIKPA